MPKCVKYQIGAKPHQLLVFQQVRSCFILFRRSVPWFIPAPQRERLVVLDDVDIPTEMYASIDLYTVIIKNPLLANH